MFDASNHRKDIKILHTHLGGKEGVIRFLNAQRLDMMLMDMAFLDFYAEEGSDHEEADRLLEEMLRYSIALAKAKMRVDEKKQSHLRLVPGPLDVERLD